MILLCTKTCEVENRAQVVALNGIGIKGMADIILSRQPIPFLDEMCTQNGIVGEPVIFQTADDKKAKKSSIFGAGATPGEQGLRWIIVALCWTTISKICLSFDLLCLLFCREPALLMRCTTRHFATWSS